MYKLLLIFRYLRRRLTPLFAALAVALCTAMVIIVISIMGGFLDNLKEAIRTLEADVVISSGLGGFPYYEELLEDLGKLEQVDSATAVIQTYGLLKIEVPETIKPVVINGVSSGPFNRVIDYENTLHWTPQRRSGAWPVLDLTRAGMTFETPAEWNDRPGIVLEIGINPGNARDEKGQYHFANTIVGETVILNIVDATRGTARPVTRSMTVVNEYKSGGFDIGPPRVFVDFDFLQKALKMNRWEGEDEAGNPDVKPAHATDILIRGRPGVNLDALREAVMEVGRRFIRRHPGMPVPFVDTWEQRYATIINAVKNERGLITFLFVIIGLVAFVMVATTFYNIVLEKTSDIGVLRALGASKSGVASVFLGYGLSIGVVGSLVGFVLAVAIVTNLNAIQYWLANYLGTTLFYAACTVGGMVTGGMVGVLGGLIWHRMGLLVGIAISIGFVIALIAGHWILQSREEFAIWLNLKYRFVMWDPRIYLFDRIPDQVDYTKAVWIMVGSTISSVIGSLIPAIVASRVNPIRALHYE